MPKCYELLQAMQCVDGVLHDHPILPLVLLYKPKYMYFKKQYFPFPNIIIILPVDRISETSKA